MENNNFMPSFFGLKDWKTANVEENAQRMNALIDFMKREYPFFTAAQLKSLLLSAVNEIDERAKI